MTKKTPRHYNIPVPYTTSGKDGMEIQVGLMNEAVQKELHRIQPEIVAKLRNCDMFHHETFSRAELDSIPDDLWAILEKHIG